MSKNRSQQMVERLRSMQAASPDIEASAIVSVDGLIMASALQADVEEDRVSAMSAAMLSLGERIASELGRGGLDQVYIKGSNGFIILTAVGSEAVLTALARQEAKLGLIFLEMRRCAEDLVKLVG
jgi:predicted regulator of Ras-like GTPase activity (Roadblock/LC7/MglB family)